MDKLKVLKILAEVKAECKKNPNCNTCTFYNDQDLSNSCLIVDGECPNEWIVEESKNG